MLSTLLNQVLLFVGFGLPIVLTGMGLPVPEEVFIIAAGLASHNGVLEPWAALLTCVVAAILGDCSMYAIGYHFGHGLLRDHRWFAWLLNPRAERRMEQQIRDHGLKALFITRFLVGVRSPVYVAAGGASHPFSLFHRLGRDLGVGRGFALLRPELPLRRADQQPVDADSRGGDRPHGQRVAAVLGVCVYFYVQHRRRIDRIRLRHLRRERNQPLSGGPSNGALRAVTETAAADGSDFPAVVVVPSGATCLGRLACFVRRESDLGRSLHGTLAVIHGTLAVIHGTLAVIHGTLAVITVCCRDLRGISPTTTWPMRSPPAMTAFARCRLSLAVGGDRLGPDERAAVDAHAPADGSQDVHPVHSRWFATVSTSLGASPWATAY